MRDVWSANQKPERPGIQHRFLNTTRLVCCLSRRSNNTGAKLRLLFNYNSKCVCSKLDSTVEDVMAEEDLSLNIKRQEEVLELVKDSVVKGQMFQRY